MTYRYANLACHKLIYKGWAKSWVPPRLTRLDLCKQTAVSDILHL